jgi:hypothetical protein
MSFVVVADQKRVAFPHLCVGHLAITWEVFLRVVISPFNRAHDLSIFFRLADAVQ